MIIICKFFKCDFSQIIKLTEIIKLLKIIYSPAEAVKKYWFDENGEKVFAPISQEEIHRRKSAPLRAYVRVPRTNWEMTPAMRARKKTTSQRTHRNYESKKKAKF